MKLTTRHVRSAWGEETEIIVGKDKGNRRRTYTLESDGDGGRYLAGDLHDDFGDAVDERGPSLQRSRQFTYDKGKGPRGAVIEAPAARFIVQEVCRLPPPYRDGTYRISVTRAEDGARGTFKVLFRRGGYEVADEDSEGFGELFRGALLIPGKIAGLLGDIDAGGAVVFPVELENARQRG